ncbi:MAG: zinc ribbon domain-containing protein [Desulfuromonadales bacterium]
MPLYEFHCTACDKTFEKLLKAHETTAACPGCQQPAEKVVSMFTSSSNACAAPSGSGFG